MKKRKLFLWETIYNRLINLSNAKYWEIDIRNLDKWIKDYPSAFPKFMVKGNFRLHFANDQFRWEIYKTK